LRFEAVTLLPLREREDVLFLLREVLRSRDAVEEDVLLRRRVVPLELPLRVLLPDVDEFDPREEEPLREPDVPREEFDERFDDVLFEPLFLLEFPPLEMFPRDEFP